MEAESKRLDANRPLNYGKTFEEWENIGNAQDEQVTAWRVARERYLVGKGDDPGEHPFANVTRDSGGSRRRSSTRKFKKSSKRVFRKKSRSTRRR